SAFDETRCHAAATEHVRRERDEPTLGELARAALRVVGDARPLVHDEDTRSRRALRVGAGELAHERDAAMLVLERLGPHAPLIATPFMWRHGSAPAEPFARVRSTRSA